MLKATVELPNAGQLQLDVDRLSEILTPPVLSETRKTEVAREKRRSFAEELKNIRAEVDLVCRQYPPHSNGYVPRETEAAIQRLRRAEQAAEETRLAVGNAKDAEEKAYIANVLSKLNEASPILLETIRLWNEAFEPLSELFIHSVQRGISPVGVLRAVPLMQDATRNLTAILNQASTPVRNPLDAGAGFLVGE